MLLLGFTYLLFVSLHQLSPRKRTSAVSIQNAFREGTSSQNSVLLREMCRRDFETHLPDMTPVHSVFVTVSCCVQQRQLLANFVRVCRYWPK